MDIKNLKRKWEVMFDVSYKDLRIHGGHFEGLSDEQIIDKILHHATYERLYRVRAKLAKLESSSEAQSPTAESVKPKKTLPLESSSEARSPSAVSVKPKQTLPSASAQDDSDATEFSKLSEEQEMAVFEDYLKREFRPEEAANSY